jgi:sugar phosphate isomerase/epimerase
MGDTNRKRFPVMSRSHGKQPAPHTCSRRQFLQTAVVAATTGATAPRLAAASGRGQKDAAPKCHLCLFTKYFQSRDFGPLGEAVNELGVHGADLTVRPGGHIAPERVADELPRAAEALRNADVEITMITTAITAADEPHAEATFRTARDLGIRYAKIGYYRVKDPRHVVETFTDAKAKLRELAALLAEHEIVGGFHNHSGTCIGALLWDEWELIRDLDRKAIGSYFDPCHAVIEGGYGGWQLGLGALAPRLTMLAIKDFVWPRDGRKRKPQIVPLAEGTVPWPAVLGRIKESGFAGPISLHMEYCKGGPPGSPEEQALFADTRRDLKYLRKQLAQAGIEAA